MHRMTTVAAPAPRTTASLDAAIAGIAIVALCAGVAIAAWWLLAHDALLRLMDAVPSAGSYDGVVLGDVLTAAVRAWVGDMADEVNEGREFATVSDVVGFPSPML